MFKTLSYKYTPNKKERKFLRLLSHISKNLYNSALYALRQEYFRTKKIMSYHVLNKILKHNVNYHILNTYTSICIVKNVHTIFNNFIKGYTKLPKYLKSNDYYLLYIEQINIEPYNQSIYIKLPLSDLTKTSKIFNKVFEDQLINKFIKESELIECLNIYFKIPKIIKNHKIIKLSIIPNYNGTSYNINFTYIYSPDIKTTTNKNLIMAIDLGINNLLTCVVSNNKSFIIDGKYLKSINYFYNKQIAYLNSRKPNQKVYTNMEYKITEKRNRRIKDAINKATRQVINYALENKISEIIIGYNKGFKAKGIKCTRSKRFQRQLNQNFAQIPLSKIKNRIKYLCTFYNIKYTEINESYTSVCSFYDEEEISYHTRYKGKRITRSLFKTSTGKIINADINGALNIMAKSKIDRRDLISFLRNIGQTVPIRQKIKLN